VKLIEGRYYKDCDGKIRGPVKIWAEGIGHCFWIESNDADIQSSVYRPDGTSANSANLVKQVPAPGFTLEVGATYENAAGNVVGPIRSNVNIYWPFVCCDGQDRVFYKASGYSCPGNYHLHNDKQDLIHKITAPIKLEDGKKYVLANGEVVTMKARDHYFLGCEWHYNENGICGYYGSNFATNTERNVVSEYVECDGQPVKEAFDEIRAKIQLNVERDCEELRAVKDAFNIACDENRELKLANEKLLESAVDMAMKSARSDLEKANLEDSLALAHFELFSARLKVEELQSKDNKGKYFAVHCAVTVCFSMLVSALVFIFL
jgi:regulator of replication initiation timing